MKRVAAGWLILALIGWSQSVLLAQRDRTGASRFGWISNYGLAKEEARKSGRPLMVVFRCVP